MKKLYSVLLLFLLFCFFLSAFHRTWALSFHSDSKGISAKRLSGEDWVSALERNWKGLRHPLDDEGTGSTAIDVSVHVKDLKINVPVPEFNIEDTQNNFERARDQRFLKSPADEDFLRRITWLYPDDGCWARASLFVKSFEEWKLARPAKVFVFGNLQVKTPNNNDGLVSWWYHVAPIVYVKKKLFVLDPAIEAKHPLQLEEWIDLMGGDAEMKISVCNSMAYDPSTSCYTPEKGSEINAEDDDTIFLDYEWARLTELGRKPEEELGAQPPWAAQP